MYACSPLMMPFENCVSSYCDIPGDCAPAADVACTDLAESEPDPDYGYSERYGDWS